MKIERSIASAPAPDLPRPDFPYRLIAWLMVTTEPESQSFKNKH
ncbi:MAG TPA: hypothetical protein VEJ63_20945 [Planctomycetota bacterium]|nr:hypothetical protein [Planctomycetota bacterium]